jgi:hypothetical protein
MSPATQPPEVDGEVDRRKPPRPDVGTPDLLE